MKTIKYSIFDLFSYTIPGAILITTCVISYNILDLENNNLKILLQKENTVFLTVLLILMSYISGFITNILGGYFFKFIALFTKKIIPQNSKSPNSTKILLLREFSPSNFNYIEKWNTMKNMCSNLAVVILICSFILIINNTISISVNLCLSITIVSLLLLKSFQFNKWNIIELDNAVHVLKLESNCEELLKLKTK